jgi:hypothetical protein
LSWLIDPWFAWSVLAFNHGNVGTPKTKYATTTDGVHIAYQSLGHGPVDLVYVPEWVSNVELQWQEPRHSRFLRGLASIVRLISIDRRGTGL